MELEVYLAETAAHAERQALMLQAARSRWQETGALTPLEFAGALHGLQVLVENAIGKAKHLLKAKNHAVPVSAYDAFELLAQCGLIPAVDLSAWQKAVGLRNRIVHDYLNLDPRIVYRLLETEGYAFVIAFLRKTEVG
ncbi:MAG: DUF86 domain-containing protein [Methylococcaceae bacterium]|nr:MAG: DUF86 domain-containing protein [Methylococcaceae bacterium]